MTSNMGSHIIQERFEKLNEKNKYELIESTKKEVFELLKQTIRPEFLNRIDEIIMFTPLNQKEIKSIVELQLKQLQQTLLNSDIKLTYTDYALEWITKTGFDVQFGARPLKRAIQKHIMNELSKQILAGKVTKDSEILLDVFDDVVAFRNPNKAEKKK